MWLSGAVAGVRSDFTGRLLAQLVQHIEIVSINKPELVALAKEALRLSCHAWHWPAAEMTDGEPGAVELEVAATEGRLLSAAIAAISRGCGSTQPRPGAMNSTRLVADPSRRRSRASAAESTVTSYAPSKSTSRSRCGRVGRPTRASMPQPPSSQYRQPTSSSAWRTVKTSLRAMSGGGGAGTCIKQVSRAAAMPDPLAEPSSADVNCSAASAGRASHGEHRWLSPSPDSRAPSESPPFASMPPGAAVRAGCCRRPRHRLAERAVSVRSTGWSRASRIAVG